MTLISVSNYDYLLARREPNIGISLTMPEMGMSLRDLISRGSRGLPVSQRTPVYSEDEWPNIKAMDLVELDNLRERTADDILAKRSKLLTEASEAKNKRVAKAERAKKVDAIIAAQDAQDKPPVTAGTSGGA